MAKSLRRFSAPKVRWRTRTVAMARRGVSSAARAARQEKHTLVAVAGAAGFGFLRRQGVTLPSFGPLTAEATAGLAAWAIGKYTRSNIASHLATGLLSVAAFDLASGGAGTSGDTTEGDFMEGDFMEGDED